MAIASRSAVPARKSQASPAKAATEPTSRVIPLSLQAKGKPYRPKPHGQTVPILPSSKPAPLWLLHLYSLQRCSFAVTFVLMAGMLAAYGWTVCSQQKWAQAYRKLDTLQHNERQLTTTNEVLKNQLAQQAEQLGTVLLPSNPNSTIFLQPAPQRPASANQSMLMTATRVVNTKTTQLPLGY